MIFSCNQYNQTEVETGQLSLRDMNTVPPNVDELENLPQARAYPKEENHHNKETSFTRFMYLVSDLVCNVLFDRPLNCQPIAFCRELFVTVWTTELGGGQKQSVECILDLT